MGEWANAMGIEAVYIDKKYKYPQTSSVTLMLGEVFYPLKIYNFHKKSIGGLTGIVCQANF